MNGGRYLSSSSGRTKVEVTGKTSSKSANSERSTESLVGKAAEEFIARMEAGERPDIDEFVRRYAEVSAPLQQVLAALEVMHSPVFDSAEDVVPAALDSSPSGVLGDFRIIRELGRGGMGIVYEAEQLSIRRRVALKVLPFAAVLDARQLQRFKNEAQAAGQLHHPNIVPVHFVGCERGVHFYAMQYIEGQTLAEVIREIVEREAVRGERQSVVEHSAVGLQREICNVSTPQPSTSPVAALSPEGSSHPREFFRTVAQLGIQAAEALDHAHQVGIIHRDIKPSNLILDVRGNLWITDFGLARVQSDLNLTMTGDLVGTLRYMSPEQALAKRVVVDHRTDIYSLAATLYELLTLRPVFSGQDRQEILRQIAFDEPQPARKVSPAIPVELETIIFKALAKNPADRYATAQSLGEDLRRFLDAEPILARRPTLVNRAKRWARRHTGLLRAAGVFAAIGILVLIASVFLIARERDIADAERSNARQAEQLERAMAQQASKAVDKMYTQVADKWLAHEPHMTSLQKEFLRDALEFYDNLVRKSNSARLGAADRAEAYYRIGELRRKFGEQTEAKEAYESSIVFWRQVLAVPPTDSSALHGLSRSFNGLARTMTDQPVEKEQAFQQSLTLSKQLVEMFPGVAEYRREMAATQASLGFNWIYSERQREAEEAFTAALDTLKRLVADDPGNADNRSTLANTFNSAGVYWARQGRAVDAETCLTESAELRRQLVRDFPAVTDYRTQLADSVVNLGISSLQHREFGQAEERIREAALLRERLTEDFPAVTEYKSGLAWIRIMHAAALAETGNKEAAESAARSSVAVYRDLKNSEEALAMALGNLANIIAGYDERIDEAAEILREAISLFDELATKSPDPDHRWNSVKARTNLAGLCTKLGRDRETTELAAEAVAVLKDLMQNSAEFMKQFDLELASVCGELAMVLVINSHPELGHLEQASWLAKQAVQRNPQNGVYHRTLGMVHYRSGNCAESIAAVEKSIELRSGGDSFDWFILAMAHWQLDHKLEARNWYGRAVEWMEKNESEDKSLKRFRSEATQLLGLNL